MHVRNRKDGEKDQCCILTGNKGKTFGHHTTSQAAEWLDVVIGREGFDFTVRLESTAICINARRRAGSRQLCPLACIVALRSARTCNAAVCRADSSATRCAVLAVDARRQHARTYKNVLVMILRPYVDSCGYASFIKKNRPPPRKKKLFLKQSMKKEEGSPASNRRRRCSSGSSERPNRCQLSPLRKRDKNNKVNSTAFRDNIRCMCCVHEKKR